MLNLSATRTVSQAARTNDILHYQADIGDLPSETPIDMLEQCLGEQPEQLGQVMTSPSSMTERRLLLILSSLAIGLLSASELARPLRQDGTSLLDGALFLLYLSLFCWVAFGFLNALAGFCVLAGRRMMPLVPAMELRLPRKRTAVLIPIYNEHVDQIFARVAKMTAMVDDIGAAKLFDFFVLSDSAAKMLPREYAAYRRVKSQTPVPVYYRRRSQNIARKPGNIAEWLRRFGGGYDYMIVLDADSLMSGSAMVRLASAMDRAPGVGLIQSIPTVINAQTLFARWQQFCAAAYGPVAAAGMAWWSGSEATFWGHNAIIRVRAFAESCGLPKLSGREPFGGHVMSHDIVEAALLRRRGWAVHMVTLPEGSHEEFPPTLTDFAIRDRRWCQGNLQHIRLLGVAGLHWVSRLQMLMGASSYIASPLWMMLMLVTLLQPLLFAATPAGPTDSPWLLGLTVALLIGPKLLSLLWLAMDQDRQRELGGLGRVARTMAVEIPLSVLVAPITMLAQTIAVASIMYGQPSGWSPQRRAVDGIPLGNALNDYRWHIATALPFLAGALMGTGGMAWLLPVVVSLLLAPFIVSITSRCDIGEWLARRGIFRTAEDEGFIPMVKDRPQPETRPLTSGPSTHVLV
ncbi:MAG: glucans biosynthesis glucosyltransferase MdoH [Alphaproteobacteria bacterium]|nr:glucans biosynthesis glucosyltransferase MdoH [Alphaproteobacteria bacterium]